MLENTYTDSLVQGETFFVELIVKDSEGVPVDLTAATPSATSSAPISSADFAVAKGAEPGSITVRADGDQTLVWAPGTHTLRVWLDWGAAAIIEDEVLMEMFVVVREDFT